MKRIMFSFITTILIISLFSACTNNLNIENNSNETSTNIKETNQDFDNYILIDGEEFSDGLAWVKVMVESDEIWGAMDTNGKIQFGVDGEPQTPFYNGVALISEWENKCVVDKTGKIIADKNDTRFDKVLAIDEGGHIWVTKSIDTLELAEIQYGILNNKGEWIHALKADDNRRTSFEPSVVQYYFTDDFFVKHTNGTSIFDFTTMREKYYHNLDVAYVPNGTGAVYDKKTNSLFLYLINVDTQEKKYITVSKDGTAIETLSVLAGARIKDGLAFWGDEDSNKYGFYDLQGNMVIDISSMNLRNYYSYRGSQFEHPTFEDGYALINLLNDNNSIFTTIIDKSGKQMFEPIKNGWNSQHLSEGLAWLYNANNDDTYSYINVKGETVIEGIHASKVYDFKNGVAKIEFNGDIYYMNKVGKRLELH